MPKYGINVYCDCMPKYGINICWGGGGRDRDTYNVTNLREVGGHLRFGDLQPVGRPVGSVVDHFDLEDSKE